MGDILIPFFFCIISGALVYPVSKPFPDTRFSIPPINADHKLVSLKMECSNTVKCVGVCGQAYVLSRVPM